MTPISLIPEVPVFGVPWHGVIRRTEDAAELELPNAATLPWVPPVATEDGWGWGHTYLQRMPWAPGAARSIEQATVDTAEGRQWLDYALLSGSQQHLCGTALTGWIYAAPDGTAWHINASHLLSNYSGGSSYSGAWTVRRMGRIGGSANQVSAVVSLPSTGQASPTFTPPPLSLTIRTRLMDILPDGSKAIVQVVLPYNRDYSSRYPVKWHPLGYWLISVTGTPGVDLAITAEVLRTRAETIGTLSDSGALTPQTLTYVARGTISTGGISVPGGTLSTLEWGDSADVEYFRRWGARTQTLTGKVLAMWFNSSGVPTPVSLTVTHAQAVDSGVIDVEYDGYSQIFTPTSGSPGPAEGELVRTETRSSSYAQSLTVAMHFGDASRSCTVSASGTLTEAAIWRADASGPTSEETHESASSTLVWPGGEESSSEATGLPSDAFSFFNPSTAGIITALERLSSTGIYAGPAAAGFAIVHPYSNNAVALKCGVNIISDPGGSMLYLGALTPGGTVTAGGTYGPEQIYGSWHPVTGLLLQGQTDPVTWA